MTPCDIEHGRTCVKS